MSGLRLASPFAAALVAACATPGGADPCLARLNTLEQQRQIDREDLRKAFTFELDSLRAELAALKAEQTTLAGKVDALKAPAKPSRPGGPDREAVYAFPVGGAPVRGPADAWVTIVEVSDFQCPYCARVQDTLQQALETYGGDVRLVFKHNPLGFHPNAMPAALAAMCAHAQGQFWPLHDLLFDNQRALGDEELVGYARELHQLSFKKWKRCFDEKAPRQAIEADQATATELGARGTPAFFINGRFLSGAQPVSAFAQLIDEELAKAKKSGLARRDYYEKGVLAKGLAQMAE